MQLPTASNHDALLEVLSHRSQGLVVSAKTCGLRSGVPPHQGGGAVKCSKNAHAAHAHNRSCGDTSTIDYVDNAHACARKRA